MVSIAEYIWLDGAKPTQALRSKSRMLQLNSDSPDITDFPDWGFDGSSTYQALGLQSDLVLKPVCFVPDPIRGVTHFLVLCEVFNADNVAHSSNTRATLRNVLELGG